MDIKLAMKIMYVQVRPVSRSMWSSLKNFAIEQIFNNNMLIQL